MRNFTHEAFFRTFRVFFHRRNLQAGMRVQCSPRARHPEEAYLRYPIVVEDKGLQGREHCRFAPWKKERKVTQQKCKQQLKHGGREGNGIISHTKPSIREMERRNPNITKD